jgi:hypothetical protein
MAPAIRRVERRACKSVLKLGPQLFILICFCDSAVASLNNKSVMYDAEVEVAVKILGFGAGPCRC